MNQSLYDALNLSIDELMARIDSLTLDTKYGVNTRATKRQLPMLEAILKYKNEQLMKDKEEGKSDFKECAKWRELIDLRTHYCIPYFEIQEVPSEQEKEYVIYYYKTCEKGRWLFKHILTERFMIGRVWEGCRTKNIIKVDIDYSYAPIITQAYNDLLAQKNNKEEQQEINEELKRAWLEDQDAHY